MNVLVFDIETVPDVESGARLYGLEGLAPEDAVRAMVHLRQQKTGSEFLAYHLHRIVAISVVLRSQACFKIWSLGQNDSSEQELLSHLYKEIEHYSPTLVSWNGGSFDLPVIHFRSLLNKVAMPRYWETGEDDTSFRYNNYLGRFHWRHIDLMDVLAGYQTRAATPLNEVATMLGFPGKMGMSEAKVWEAFLEGELEGIRNYCETDVLNTFLIYLRFELMRGRLTAEMYESECQRVKDTLAGMGKPHWQQFLEAWQ